MTVRQTITATAWALLLAAALATLTACTGQAQLQPEVRTVEVKVPTPVPCIDPKDVPAVPLRLSEERPTMPTSADELAHLALAKVAELFQYAKRADGALRACAQVK